MSARHLQGADGPGEMIVEINRQVFHQCKDADSMLRRFGRVRGAFTFRAGGNSFELVRPSSFATLRRFAGVAPVNDAAARRAPPEEHCELCSVPLGPIHRHLLEMATRKILCACDPCALRFENVVEGKFKLIPRDARALPDFHMTDAEWENLALPIDLAFFFYSTPYQKMAAMYPSPAGPTESLLPLTSWEMLSRQNPPLQTMEADVEALLVNRAQGAREYFLAPIDACFELVGTIRVHWRGLSGGDELWREIEKFFAKLRAQSPVWKEPTPERNGA